MELLITHLRLSFPRQSPLVERSLKTQNHHLITVRWWFSGGEGGLLFETYQYPPYSSWLILTARVTPQEGFELISRKLDEVDNKIVD
jgi:hypothetical protein